MEGLFSGAARKLCRRQVMNPKNIFQSHILTDPDTMYQL